MRQVIEKQEGRYPPISVAEHSASKYRTYILCFFLSGAAGLIYQIAWIRILSLVFGNTLYAVSMVVAAFLSGLAIGSHFWGKRADVCKDPFKTYVNLEILIAVSSACVTFLIYILDDWFVSVMTVESIGSGSWQFIRYVLLFVLLLAPTSFMGGTLPMMSKFFIRSFETIGRGVGTLYAANTYGGMAGCFLSGLAMVPFLGVKGTVEAAIFINLFVAALLSVTGSLGGVEDNANMSERPQKSFPKQKKRKKKKAVLNPQQGSDGRAAYKISFALALLLITISGFNALIYEVLWTRAFIVFFKSTVYLFSNLLTVFLFGIALGSHLATRILDKHGDPVKLFGIAQVGIGLFGILSIIFFMYSKELAISLGTMFGGMDWTNDILVMLILMLLAFLVPTVLIGLSFPLICRVVADSLGSIGRKVGVVYAAGTAGGIIGSLAAGFLMIPLLGLQKGLFIVSFFALINGYIALFNAASRKGTLWVLPASAGFAIVAFIGFEISGTDIGLGSKTVGKLVFAREGVMGTVKVVEKGSRSDLTLMVNNYQLATSGDVAVRFGHIPLVLKPDAEDVLLISLGSGITAGSIGAHPVKRIENVEIVPTLLDVQPLFARDNKNIVSDKRFHLTFWDGRHYVRVTKRKYDMVISDLYQPDSAGVGSLYTLEHFLNVKAKLKKGGAMAQWLPLYQLSPDNLKVIMRTFAHAFEHVIVWAGDINPEAPTLMLFGSSDPFYIQPEKFAKSLELETVKTDLIDHADPLSFLSFYIMDRDGVMRFTEGSPINTDDRPVIEYSAPRHLWHRRENALINFASLIGVRRNISALLPRAGADKELVDSLKRYFKGRTEILIGKVENFRRNYHSELKHYQEAAKYVPSDPYLSMAVFDLGYMYFKGRDYNKSAEILKWAKKINPDLLEAHFYLAKSYERMGKKEDAIQVLTELARLRPDIADQLIAR
ncbi:MAG: fused MFS/spermidine synthase [Nitrospinota bacterium]